MRNGLKNINMFCYDEILAETHKGIQLLIKTDQRLMNPWLPKKHIGLFRYSKEVAIPEWLCLKTELIPIIENEPHKN